MNNNEKPIYSEFPIFQISYILFWIPLGYIISSFCASLIIFVLKFILVKILHTIFDSAFEMYVYTGAMDTVPDAFYLPVLITLDIILLIAGLEFIIYMVRKSEKKKDTAIKYE